MTLTVFVSSTFVDLQPHRKAIWDMLRAFDVTVRGMEQFGARTETPLQTCLAEVDQSDIYVGVIAFRQGSIEPTSGKSYTQLEYERAIHLSKEVFIYLIDEENARVQVKYMDRGEAQEKLDSFKSILRERHTIDSFRDEADLVAKVKRDMERLVGPKAPSESQLDELTASRQRLETFLLLPKSVAGTEVRLVVRATGDPYPASRAICEAFSLEFGGTIGLPVALVQPDGVDSGELPDLYIDAKHAVDLLPLAKDDLLDGYVKLHFSSKEIVGVQARYRPRTAYPNSALMRSAIAGVLGAPVHYEADSRLAFELSKSLKLTRAKDSAV